jgi:predicted metalloendopeptidase
MEKAQCIIDQYGNYTDPQVDMKLNGINNQGENIADNGGVKQAYKAYRKFLLNNF